MQSPEEIIALIEKAFAGVQLGAGTSIREADVIDSYGSEETRARARALDEQHDWRKIPDETIETYHWVFSFFDAEGMRFNAPAYMCYALRHLDDRDPYD